MFTKKFELFSLLGFRVSLDLTWFILAVLIVWSLAQGYFPAVIDGLDPQTALVLGVAGALGLFFSIVFHEFSHAIVARRYDIPIKGITLFIFGGVAEMEQEPPSAKSEFLMAIAGPIASYVLAAVFYLVALAAPGIALAELFSYLGLINLVLATFNLVPAFPLDGGRVLRAGIWWWTNDLPRATRIGAGTGRVLGSLLVALGFLNAVSGNVVAGMWQALIGLFIIGAARSTEMRMTMTSLLDDVPVSRLMVRHPVTVPDDTPVDYMIENYFYRFNHKIFPVLRDGRLLGCVRLDDVSKVPPDKRGQRVAADILAADSAARIVGPDCSVLDAIGVMQQHNVSRLMVAEGDRLAGLLTMRDIMSHVSIHQQLDGAAQAR
ncbi:site-2 protease family protein [Roseovarius salis]|uniref:site-2 protease family protein n=1 Tax=Roseovarius salis TaxID=3376063 RepID=UPI0037CC31D6